MRTKKQFSQKDLKEIYEVETGYFPEVMQETFDSLKEILTNPRGIHLLVKKDGKIVSYATALPYLEAYEGYLKEHDPDLHPDPTAFYLESFAPLGSDPGRLFWCLIYEVQKRGYQKIVTHAESGGILWKTMMKHRAHILHGVPNWYDFGRHFDFMEYAIP